MPDWKSPQELEKAATAFIKLMHSLLGLYAYEWFISLDFDWDFVSRKKAFRWPMVFYFANRYLLLFALVGIAISLDTTTPIDCQAIYTFNQLAGDASVGLASINLSIRTMAIWSQNRYIIAGLVVIIMGHWSLILQGVQLKAVWIPATGCVITDTNNTILAAIFIYSMCFDLIVLLLNTYKLLGVNSTSTPTEMMGRSRLTQMIFADGLIYFIIAFLANLIATVFMLLDFNQLMSVIFNVPAAIFSTIVACRAVRRLTNFKYNGPEVFSSHNRVAMTGNNGRTTVNYKQGSRSGVHVQMETFTHAEERNHIHDDIFNKSKGGEGSDTDIEMDVEAKGDL